MTFRFCIYKDCGNYINLGDRSQNTGVKLFSFPKNPERRQKWLELGKVSPNLSASLYYFCSDHFDKKFFASNSVRTILVGEALPYPYVQTEFEETYEEDTDNTDLYLQKVNKNNELQTDQLQNEQDLHVESTTTVLNELKDELLEHYTINVNEQPNECTVYTDEESYAPETTITNSKRKILQTQASSSNAKVLKTYPLQKPLRNLLEKPNIKSVEQTPTILKTQFNLCSMERVADTDRELHKEIDTNELVDPKHVTTFIFKGEEYVQMPKEYYVNEKIELLTKLQKMERTVKVIKEHLNTIDI